MRSKLFVPGGRPDLFAKACASAADAVSFDLEDAVPEDAKAEARADVAAFVATRARASRKPSRVPPKIPSARSATIVNANGASFMTTSRCSRAPASAAIRSPVT